MYSKHRRIPIEVSHWIEKDVKITTTSVESGHIGGDARQNLQLNRQFYTKMLSISYDRYRKTALFEFQKENFMKDRRRIAEKTLPGLLPHIENLTEVMNEKPPSSRYDELISSSFQTISSRSFFKPQSKLSNKDSKTSKLAPIKSSDHPQKARSRIHHLALPKGHYRERTLTTDHTRSCLYSPTAEDMFGSFDDVSNFNSYLPVIPVKTTEDRRFRQLIHTFSEMHERDPTHVQTLKNLIESNESLQGDPRREQTLQESIILEDDHEDEQISLVDVAA